MDVVHTWHRSRLRLLHRRGTPRPLHRTAPPPVSSPGASPGPAPPAAPQPPDRLPSPCPCPADIAAAVPHIVGFHPEESLVVISLRGPRKRIGLTMRFDLPPMSLHAVMADEVAIRLTGDKAEHAVIACCTTEASDGARPPRADLIAMIRERLRDRDIAMLEALFIRDGRWWSYLCEDPDCCPPCGAEVPPSTDIAAAQALVGRALLPERQSL